MPSQFGQAEWIKEFFAHIGQHKGIVFEAGAQRPDNISNSMCFLESDWEAFLVEADIRHVQAWQEAKIKNAYIFHKAITYKPESLQFILDELDVPLDLDVLFLDIDGAEYHLLDGMYKHRPKIICVEYDNSYPLSIKYIPKQMRHSVESSQASSSATYNLMRQKGYTYLKSFFLDHIFIEDSFLASHKAKILNKYNFGFEYFCEESPKHLYNVISVLLNQKDNQAALGINFYQVKLQNLIDNDLRAEASIYYGMLENLFINIQPIIANRGEVYLNDFMNAVELFRTKYKTMLITFS